MPPEAWAALFGGLSVGVPGTILALATYRQAKGAKSAAEAGAASAEAANLAVNHKPENEPTLYERVRDMERHQTQQFDQLTRIDSRLDGHAVSMAGIGARLSDLADSIATLTERQEPR